MSGSIEFLQWCLPELQYQWKGFRKVRKQVCKRINRRLSELNLPDLSAYRYYLEKNDDEWLILDSLCNITISRFYRDQGIFNIILNDIFPLLAKIASKGNIKEIRCWSAGCGSGEEPYTLKILWDLNIFKKHGINVPLWIVATDRKSEILERAHAGIYSKGSLKEVPEELTNQAFIKYDEGYKLKDKFKTGVEYTVQDIRKQLPKGKFDIILCRNLVFTYFDEDLQINILNKIEGKLAPGGFLIIGAHESLPSVDKTLIPYKNNKCIYHRAYG